MPVGDAERAERALIGVVSDLGILPGNLGWASIRVVRKSLLVRAIEGLDYGMNGSRCRTCKCIISAMTNASVTIKKMRFISATSLCGVGLVGPAGWLTEIIMKV